MQNRAWGLGTPTDLAASNTQDPDLCPLYMAHRHKDALGWMGGILSEHRHRYEGAG
jgi:hypothetical protein